MACCAPGAYDPENDTCLSLEDVEKLVESFNKIYLQNQIKITNNKKEMLQKLRRYFKCKNDWCVTQKLPEEVRETVRNRFRPLGPRNNTNWLSTKHIEDLLKQYEVLYPDFKFIGAVPIDCDKYDFCSLHQKNFDLDQMYQENIKKIGIIYNLDKMGESGSHWVAMYFDLDKAEIDFCDSNGTQPNKYIENLIKTIINWCKKNNIQNKEKIVKDKNIAAEHINGVLVKLNKLKFQYDNTECGIYSSNMIISLLSGKSLEEILQNHLTYKESKMCRREYFLDENLSCSTPNEESIRLKCDPTLSLTLKRSSQKPS
jgi:hypothetical protein